MYEIEINDVYEGAYLVLQGHRLKDLTKGAGSKQVTFVLAGERVREDAEEFRSGRATGNIALYLFTLEKLKDQLFQLLRRAGE